MSLAPETLPDDPEQLRALGWRSPPTNPSAHLVAMSAERDEARAEVDKLQLLISELQRMQFGRHF